MFIFLIYSFNKDIKRKLFLYPIIYIKDNFDQKLLDLIQKNSTPHNRMFFCIHINPSTQSTNPTTKPPSMLHGLRSMGRAPPDH